MLPFTAGSDLFSVAYGLLWAESGVIADYTTSGTVKANESYPAFPGDPLAFCATRDMSHIADF